MGKQLYSDISTHLGRNPLPIALLYWLAGIAFCFMSLQIHKIDQIWGSILVGLSTFVNFFCFIQGVNYAKRAIARWRTLYKAKKLAPTPDIVRCDAGFVVVDFTHNVLICNGREAHFQNIERIICKSTPIAHKMDLWGTWRMPIIVGFVSLNELTTFAEQLRNAVQKIQGKDPIFVPVYDAIHSEQTQG